MKIRDYPENETCSQNIYDRQQEVHAVEILCLSHYIQDLLKEIKNGGSTYGFFLKKLSLGIKFYNSKIKDKTTKVNINANPTDLANMSIVNEVKSIIKENGIESNRIVIEITEHEWEGDKIKQIITNLKGLNNLGVIIAIDDFGDGISNFGNLYQILDSGVQVGYIKISGYLLREAFQEYKKLTKNMGKKSPSFLGEKLLEIRTLVTLCNQENIQVIAEEIDSWEKYDFFKRLGIQLFQGNYLRAKECHNLDNDQQAA